jgi:NAD(P)-dependent dehydrogenase (short-subunit alcohol dehydrogenase family)
MMRPLSEQTIVITGATDGLGRALAGELAAAGAALALHGRDDARGLATIRELRERTGNDRLQWFRADLASLDEVRDLARRLQSDLDRIDVLVNNAGIGATLPGDGFRCSSRDGYELRFAVNYLSHYLLTRSLLPLIVASAPARIVNVSSGGQAPIDFDDVMLERDYDPVRAYAQSKLAQVMFTIDLAEELRGSGVTVNCLHPATFMPTKMVVSAGVQPASTLEDGVEATMRLVTAPELDELSGRYFNRTRQAQPQGQALDAAARRRLRDLSDQLTGLRGVRGLKSEAPTTGPRRPREAER